MAIGNPPGALAVVSAKVKGGTFSTLVVAVVIIFAGEYVFHTVFDLLPGLWPQPTAFGIAATAWFNVVFVLGCAAYLQSVRTDPGTIPIHWGFYIGDAAKRKRYCRDCHRWKPDRTHHCSACKKCVLTMDHHCPWINNCVGFYNRKFFLQLLFYGLLGLMTIFIHSLSRVVLLLWTQFALTDGVEYALQVSRLGFAILVISTTGFLLVALAQFLKFHLKLVGNNLTTIENLDALSRNACRYDVGLYRNLAQVLGPRPWLWWLPSHSPLSLPTADGVRWPLSEAALLAQSRLADSYSNGKVV